MATNTKGLYDETVWEKFENRLKELSYSLMHELLQTQIVSPFLYKVIIIIETIQLFYYSIHPIMNGFLWQTDVLTYIRDAVQYFQLNYVINNGDSNVNVILLYIVFGLMIFVLLLVAGVIYKISTSKKTTSTFLTYSIKILSLFALLLTSIATLPFFNIFISILYCNQNNPASQSFTCYSGIYFLHLVIAIVGMILLIAYSLMFTMLYIDLNPSSTIPFAAPQSRLNLYRLVLKVLILIYVIIDYKGQLAKQYIIVLAALYLILLIMRYRTTPYYNFQIQLFVTSSEAALLWVSLCVVVQAFLNFDKSNSLVIFFVFFCIPFFAYAVIEVMEARKWSVMKMEIKNLKKDSEVEMYANIFIDLIERKEKIESRIKLEGLLKYHWKFCHRPKECPCSELVSTNLKEEDSPEKTQKWYTVVKNILVDCIDRFPKSPRLHLLYSFLQHEKLKNKFKALYELQNTRDNKPNIQEDFSAHRFQNLIEEEMIESDIRNSESKGIDFNMIVTFQNKFVDFQTAIHDSVDLHLDFWKELLEDNPDIHKLQALGSRITNTVEETSDQFKKLNEMNPNNIKCLEIYGYFLKDIVNDDAEGQRILEKAEYVGKSTMVNKQFVDNERLKYGENSKTCIITCSGSFNSLGQIVNINNEITRILGFPKSDLMGQNVNRIMPKVYADRHDGFMRNYFETSKGRVMGLERLVFPISKQGYLIPSSLRIKVLPNLDEGIRIVGFLKDGEDAATDLKTDFDSDEKQHYIMYDQTEGLIHGVSQSCYTSFGIPANLCYGSNANTNEFTIDIIAPELKLSKNIEEMATQAGTIVTLDTTTLQQNFLLGNEDSDFKEDREEEEKNESEASNSKINKFRKTKVRCFNLIDAATDGIPVNIVKFFEVDENEDIQKVKSKDIGATQTQQGPTPEKTMNADIEVKKKDDEANQDNPNGSQVGGGVGEDVDRSDRTSNVSGTSMADEMRQLKDFKAMISEKTQPKSIRVLKRTFFGLFAGIIAITSVELAFKFSQNSLMTEGLTGIYLAQMRHSFMADVNLYTRFLNLIYQANVSVPLNGTANLAALVTQYQAQLSNSINALQANQFDVIKARITMNNRMSNPPGLESYNIQFMLQDGSIKVYSNIFNDAEFQYITFASSIRNASLFSTAITDVQSNNENFFFVLTNGLLDLRFGSEWIGDLFINFYQSDEDSTIFLIFMICEIGFIVLSQFILIPIVFTVHRTNNKVLALFGYIPKDEINNLVKKCDRYMDKYLDDHNNEKKEGSVQESQKGEEDPKGAADQSYIKDAGLDGSAEQPENVKASMMSDGVENRVNNLKENGITANPSPANGTPTQNGTKNGNIVLEPNGLPPKTAVSQPLKGTPASKTGGDNTLGVPHGTQAKAGAQSQPIGNQPTVNSPPGNTPSAQALPNAKSQQPGQPEKKESAKDKTKEAGEEKQEGEEEDNDRTKKLLNSKDGNRKMIILQFTLLTALFIAYFVGSYVIELNLVSNVQTANKNLYLLAQRPSILKYVVVFTIEEISTATLVQYRNTTLRDDYYNRIYNNEGQIYINMKGSFPGQFSTFQSQFQALTYNDVCGTFFASSTDQTNCQKIANGLLQKGLKIVDVSIVEFCRDAVTKFEATNMNYTAMSNAIASTDIQLTLNLMTVVGPALDSLWQTFAANYNDYLTAQLNIERMKFGLFLAAVLLCFVYIWSSYLENLSVKIWRTKGMLNMIPMDLISKNDVLKRKFISGDLLQAVK